MYEHKTSQIDDLKILGIKCHERIRDNIEIYDHEFKDDNEEQEVLAGRTICTHKIFGFPILKWQSCYDPEHLLPPEPENKIILPVLNKLAKISLITTGSILAGICIFVAGISTAHNDWFNNTVYIKSYQMQNLNIKSLKPYDKALFKDAYSQVEMDEASAKRYEHYHEYYKKVVYKIKSLDFNDEKVHDVIVSYIDGYDKRKEEMINVLFPHLYDKDEYGANYYGTIIGSIYPKAMMEFDRQELLTYRMILENMYAAPYIEDFDGIFEE